MPEKRWPRLVLVSLGLVAAVIVVWIAIGNAWMGRRERQEEQAWTETFGSIEALQRKYPPAPGNEAARKAEQAAKVLGINLAPHVGESWSTEGDRSKPETSRMLDDIDEWRNRTLSDPTSSISAAPGTFVAFSTAHRAGLDELENLLTAETPRWKLDAAGTDHADHTYPNLLGQMRLQKLLVSDALESSRNGNRDSSLRALEASWSLNSSLLGRPELISQLIAIAVARFQAGALRKIDVGASPWRARMTGVDPRAKIFDALLFEHPPHGATSWHVAARERALWLSRRGSEDVPTPPVSAWLRRLVSPVKDPIERWQNVEVERQLRSAYREIRPHVTDAIGVKKVAMEVSGLASIAIPNLLNSFERAERLVVDAELTERVLRAREARAANHGSWPASISGIEATRVQGAHWIYAVAPGGTASIALDRNLPPPEQPAPPLPLRWTSG